MKTANRSPLALDGVLANLIKAFIFYGATSFDRGSIATSNGVSLRFYALSAIRYGVRVAVVKRLLTNITGGNTGPQKTATGLAVLKPNFIFLFSEADQSFESDFVHQSDVDQSMKVEGFYTAVKEKISFHHHSVNNQPAARERVCNFSLNEKQMRLISLAPSNNKSPLSSRKSRMIARSLNSALRYFTFSAKGKS